MSKPTENPPTSPTDINLDVLEDTLSFYIRTINLAVSRDLDARLDGLDVAKGTGKITTLLLVDDYPGIRPSVIAHLTMRDRSAMGRIIDQMVSHDLIRREVSQEDSRAQSFTSPKPERHLQRKSGRSFRSNRAISSASSRKTSRSRLSTFCVAPTAILWG